MPSFFRYVLLSRANDHFPDKAPKAALPSGRPKEMSAAKELICIYDNAAIMYCKGTVSFPTNLHRFKELQRMIPLHSRISRCAWWGNKTGHFQWRLLVLDSGTLSHGRSGSSPPCCPSSSKQRSSSSGRLIICELLLGKDFKGTVSFYLFHAF